MEGREKAGRSRRKGYHLVVSAATIAAMVAISVVNASDSPGSSQQHRTVSVWAEAPHYDTMGSLLNASDHVVVARATRLSGTMPAGDLHPTPFTGYDMEVQDVLIGSPEQVFRTYQLGGVRPSPDGPPHFVVRGDPPIKLGQTTVLFLGAVTESAQGGEELREDDIPLYRIVGGPQGRFIVEASKVYSLDTIDADAEVRVQADGIPLQEFIQAVRRVAS